MQKRSVQWQCSNPFSASPTTYWAEIYLQTKFWLHSLVSTGCSDIGKINILSLKQFDEFLMSSAWLFLDGHSLYKLIPATNVNILKRHSYLLNLDYNAEIILLSTLYFCVICN